MSDFGDKLKTLGFARKRGTSRKIDKVNEDNGTEAGYEVEHWDDRRDAVIQPKTVQLTTKIKEE